MKRGRQGQRTDLKTAADIERNRKRCIKAGRASARSGNAFRLNSEQARALAIKRWGSR